MKQAGKVLTAVLFATVAAGFVFANGAQVAADIKEIRK